jgi:hypothetical protein
VPAPHPCRRHPYVALLPELQYRPMEVTNRAGHPAGRDEVIRRGPTARRVPWPGAAGVGSPSDVQESHERAKNSPLPQPWCRLATPEHSHRRCLSSAWPEPLPSVNPPRAHQSCVSFRQRCWPRPVQPAGRGAQRGPARQAGRPAASRSVHTVAPRVTSRAMTIASPSIVTCDPTTTMVWPGARSTFVSFM